MKTFKQYLLEKKLPYRIRRIPDWNEMPAGPELLSNLGRSRVHKLRPFTAYHGTDEKSAKNILENGARKEGISLTTDLSMAVNCAYDAGESAKTHGVVLAVKSKGLNHKRIKPNDMPSNYDIYHKGEIDKKHFRIKHIVVVPKGKNRG